MIRMLIPKWIWLYGTTLDLHADVFEIDHHGNKTSISAVISCGITSKKDYLDVEVGMNLMSAGLFTYVHGTIVLTIGGGWQHVLVTS